MIDVVYILGNESVWRDNEIKYSVRSVEMHLKNFRNIFIVGDKPAFFNDKIIEIPYKDIYGNKARNIKEKIMRAAIDERVSKDFMLFNDDYYLLKPADAKNYPYYYKNELPEALKKNPIGSDYRPHVEATIKLLEYHGLKTRNFDCHYPIIYNKKYFKDICKGIDWKVPYGYIMKSVYCNFLEIKGEFIEDCKVNHPHLFQSWKNMNQDRPMFSIGDFAVNSSLKDYMNYLYPNKSSYEK